MNGTTLDKLRSIPSLEPAEDGPEEIHEDSPEEIRKDIKDKKEAIAETLNRLDQRVHRATDWRAQVGDHPYLALSLAVSAGYLLSGIFKSKPSPRERMMDALAEGVEDITDQVRDRIESYFSWPAKGGALKATAAALAAKAASSYLSNRLSSASKARNA